MTSLDKRINALISLGKLISAKLDSYNSDNELKELFRQAFLENSWYTEENILNALKNWSLALNPEFVNKWVSDYNGDLKKDRKELRVAVINAGNIPFVGLHDLISVILCGHSYVGKNATGDSILLPHIASILCECEPSLKEKIRFVPKIENIQAVIATGNNNSARYFEYYFGKYPHIIRKNRNGVGVLNGRETNEQLRDLSKDIFTYFGLGCRNISKLYVPAGYNFNKFFEAMEDFRSVAQHNKYMNNFEYNNSVFLLKQIPFLQNGFLIVRKEKQISSPVSVIHSEEYSDTNSLTDNLKLNIDQLQCIVSNEKFDKENNLLEKIRVDFGQTQSPQLWDYADGVNTVKFLCEL